MMTWETKNSLYHIHSDPHNNNKAFKTNRSIKYFPLEMNDDLMTLVHDEIIITRSCKKRAIMPATKSVWCWSCINAYKTEDSQRLVKEVVNTLCIQQLNLGKVFNCNWWLCWVEMVHPMNTFKYKLGTIIYWICSTAQSQYQYHQSSLFIWSVFDLVARDLNFCMCTVVCVE